MTKQIEHTNKNGVKFSIEIEKQNVPEEANYWLFHLKVTEQSTGRKKIHPAMISRDSCPNESDAADSFEGTPIQALKSALEAYQNGSIPLGQITTNNNWIILT